MKHDVSIVAVCRGIRLGLVSRGYSEVADRSNKPTARALKPINRLRFVFSVTLPVRDEGISIFPVGISFPLLNSTVVEPPDSFPYNAAQVIALHSDRERLRNCTSLLP